MPGSRGVYAMLQWGQNPRSAVTDEAVGCGLQTEEQIKAG